MLKNTLCLAAEMPRMRYGSKIMRVVRKTPQDDLLRRPVSAEQKGSGPCIMAERLKSYRVARVDRIVVVSPLVR